MLEFSNEIENEVPQDDSADIGEKLLLYSLVRALRPECVVETGTHRGKTALYIAHALYENEKGHLWTADPFEWGAEGNFRKFPELEKHITFVKDKGTSIKLESIDFLFIDGFHEKAEVLAEIEALFPQLSENAVVVFHDCDTNTNQYADVNGAIQEKGLATVWLPTQNRMRIYQHSNI